MRGKHSVTVLVGLATDGAAGVHAVFEELRTEFARALALCGAASVGEVTSDLLVTPSVQSL
ncbi:MAG: alpha-hydroxy-acid oxidizing protein [Egibacteraceae bacterium]